MLEMGATLQGSEGRKRRDSLLSPNQVGRIDYLSIDFPNSEAPDVQLLDLGRDLASGGSSTDGSLP